MTRGTDAEALGARLAARRRAVGMSQSNLEQLTGVPKARLSRYENGRVIPSVTTLVRIARHLGVSLDDVTRGLFDDVESE
jgi:transcriptional regulator with XRE-family HTH domain